MPTRSGMAKRLRCSGAPLGLAVPLVALAAWPGFVDPYTSVKWYALEAFAAGWLLSERWLGRGEGLPSFACRTGIVWVVLAAWVVAGSLRHGPAWAMVPLLARASFLSLVLASYWSLRRTNLSLDLLQGSVTVAAAIVVTLGLLQMAGLPPLPWLAGGDQRSATFGNVNMTAQFVGLALVVLFSGRSRASQSLSHRLVREALGAGSIAYLVLAGTRSVAVALLGAFAVLALLRRSTELLARAGVALVVVVVVVLLPLAPPELAAWPPAGRASKATSARWRLAVWHDTLALARDHPLGVGAGNFEHAFTPYALEGRSRPGENLVFRSPHNDYLRLLAEEGIPGAVGLLIVLLLPVLVVIRSPADRERRSDVSALLASSGTFLAVEAFFQFPFELPFPALLAAVLLGLALAAVEGPRTADRRGFSPRLAEGACVLVAGLLLAGTARVAVADHLFATSRGDLPSLERACRLDPRRLDACVEAAWHHSRTGRHEAAQAELAAVLRRSPAYYPALKLRAEDLLAAGRRDEACRHAREYDTLFAGASSLHPLVSRECAGVGGGRTRATPPGW